MTLRRILLLLLACALLVGSAMPALGELGDPFGLDAEKAGSAAEEAAATPDGTSDEAADEMADETPAADPEEVPEDGGLAEETGEQAADEAEVDVSGLTAHMITDKCAFKVSTGSTRNILDGKVTTGWTYGKVGAWVGFMIPADEIACGFIVEWDFDPTGFSIEEYDAQKNLLRTRDQSCTFPGIVSNYPLLTNTRYVVMRMTAKGQQVDQIYVYSAGAISAAAQIWEAPVEKADLMVVSTHQDDELIYLGGTIPYYAVAQQRPTVVVYMADCGRYRRKEALNGLWAMGYRNYPIFLNLKDERIESLDDTLRHWGGKDKVLRLLVEQIRRFKPEVLVAQDLNGEYGHNQHKLTAAAVYYAILAAADEQYYPESAEKYGVWQVKKLYNHLFGEHQIKMDWQTPLEELGGKSPLQVAQRGYQEHASQHDYFQVVAGGQYDNAKFGLRISTVGWDEQKNDFFENIVPPEPDPTPTPEPTAEPEETEAPLIAADDPAARFMPEATPTPGLYATATPEPTEAPAPTRSPADDGAPSRVLDENGDWILPTVGMVGVAGLLGVMVSGINRTLGGRKRRRK